MIALITSTIIPNNDSSLYNPTERLGQTINTIRKLREANFSDIYLFDNSIKEIDIVSLTNEYDLVKIFHSPQYTFENKGLNEALLILNNWHNLPSDIPIFKISGRYYPASSFSKDISSFNEEKEFIGVGYNFTSNVAGFSTKAYFVKNKDALATVLVQAIEDMVSYSKGIHGVKSAFNAIKEIFKPYLGTHYQLSIEQSFARILKQKNNYILVDKMSIEGLEATSSKWSLFSE